MSYNQDVQAAADALAQLSPEERLSLIRQSLTEFAEAESAFDPIVDRQLSARELIQVGTIVYDFCNGVFGRDSYDDKVAVARGEHEGEPWAVLAEVDDWRKKKWLYFASGARDFELMADNLQPEEEN